MALGDQGRRDASPRALLEVDSDCEAGPQTPRKRINRSAAVVSLAAGALAVVGCLALASTVREGYGGVTETTAPNPAGVVELTLIQEAPPSDDAAPIDDEKEEEEEKKAGRRPLVEHTATSEKVCSWGKENCNATKCCNNAGMQCFEQNNYYAQCREACAPAPDPTHWDGLPWTCKALGERAEGSSKCSGPGEDCSQSHCCSETGMQCFEKAPGWAACKSECAADGPDLTDADEHYWSCKKLGPRAEGAAPWVADQCSGDGDDCRKTQCCQSPGAMCYEQSPDWAACKQSCTAGKDPERSWEPEWTCKELGVRTPGNPPAISQVLAGWVPEKCAWQGTDCKGPRCCVGMNQQCYEKDENWAMCMEDCKAGPNPDDKDETWSCRPLGPRSKGLSLLGDPSLFCWSLFQPTSYEMEVIQNQLARSIGIFQCDGYALLSTADPTSVGVGPDGKDIVSLHADMAEITTSVDGTAGNAALFINCWNVIIEDGRWNNFAWTVKVDPDAVLLPDRLRQHLAPHVLENVFVLNCNAFPSSPEFPMMYGALEIFSWKAISSYANGMWECMRDMAEFIPLWGEDRFMKKCMDHIGVGTIQDFSAVGDGVCTGVDCGSSFVAAFHPFKTVDSWQQCWDIAHR